MKKEYDFTKGIRGKFYNENATFNIPVYLEPDNELFIRKIAEEKQMTFSGIVNQLLSKDRELILIGSSF
ncbi:MAG: hypothetical protein PHV62_08265 [Sulfuricurvum sp.]|nr:hypothetical protein [Sulfuricurvum sp.]